MLTILVLATALQVAYGFAELDAFVVVAVKHSRRTMLRRNEINESAALDPFHLSPFSIPYDDARGEDVKFEECLLVGLSNFEVKILNRFDSEGRSRLALRFPSLDLSGRVSAEKPLSEKVKQQPSDSFIIQFLDSLATVSISLEQDESKSHFQLRFFYIEFSGVKKHIFMATGDSAVMKLVSAQSEKLFRHVIQTVIAHLGAFLKDELENWFEKHNIKEIRSGDLKIGDDAPVDADPYANSLRNLLLHVQAALRRSHSSVFRGKASERIKVVTKKVVITSEIFANLASPHRYQVLATVDDLLAFYSTPNKRMYPISFGSVRYLMKFVYDRVHRRWILTSIRILGIDGTEMKGRLETRRVYPNKYSYLLLRAWTEKKFTDFFFEIMRLLY